MGIDKGSFMEERENEESEKGSFMEESEDEENEKDGFIEESEDEESEKDGFMEESEDEENNMPSSSSATEMQTNLQKYMEADKLKKNKSLINNASKNWKMTCIGRKQVKDLLVIKTKLESQLQVCQDKCNRDLEELRIQLETERASHEELKSRLAITRTSHQECKELANEIKECPKVNIVFKKTLY